jgi:glycosyltransferase involved in cell wall biosynthesis
MRFSLLLATLNRTIEMQPFLDSLASQTWREFELIVIDQNSDARLDDILAPYQGRFEIRRLRSPRGHSRALNLGLAHAAGDLVAFPDDDCWYNPDTLERVAAFFQRYPASSGLTGREIVKPEFRSGSRWDRQPGRVTRGNVWRRAITFTIFLRREAAANVAFDETLGIGAGSPWGAGEETHYLLQLLGDGHAIHYDPELTVWHQGRSGQFTDQVYAKAHHYAMGIGRVLRITGSPLPLAVYHFLRPLGGVLLSLARGRGRQCIYHWVIFRGRVKGWTASPCAVRLEAVSEAVPSRRASV